MGYGYVPITVTNSESSATSTNFQQLVTVDLSYYSSFLNADLSNTFFSSDTAGSSVLTSIIESGNSYPFGSVNFWVVLSDGIAANSSTTIYLQIDLSLSSHINKTTTGLACNLTSSYGEYDNSSSIFNFYDNFSGTTLDSSNWSSGGTFTVNNGISLNDGYIYSTATYSSSDDYTLDVFGYNDLTGNQGFGSFVSNSNSFSGADVQIMAALGSPNRYTAASAYVSGYSDNTLTESIPFTTNYIFTLSPAFASSGNTWYLTYNQASAGVPSSVGSLTYIGASGGSSTNAIYIQYIRLRYTPPNGVMPSISTSNPVNFPYINTSTSEDLF